MLIKKIYNNIRLMFYSLIYSMSGPNKILTSSNNSNDVEIIDVKNQDGGVFYDLLQEKKTQQVVETVDAYYRVFKESDKFDTSSIRMIDDGENGYIFVTDRLKRKLKTKFMKHIPIFNPDNLDVRTIQDNRHLENKYETSTSLYKYDTILTVFRDEFTPRFEIDKLVKKMVVRDISNKNCLVDLYLPCEASQFGKIDAIIISNLYTLMNEKRFKSDLIEFTGFEWVSDKAWNSDDICLFKYNVIDIVGINKFDGSFVISYLCEVVNDGTDLTEKYKTESLDEKYKTEAPKRDDIDIFTYERKIKRENEKNKKINIDNLETTRFKLSE